MAKEDEKVWYIKGARRKSPGIPAGVWDIEKVVGTQRAKHRVNIWKAKYANDKNVKIIRTQKG